MNFFDFIAWTLGDFFRFIGVWILLYVVFSGVAGIVGAFRG